MRKYFHWKTYSIIIGSAIVVIALFQFNQLAQKMAAEERRSVAILIEALKTISISEFDPNNSLDLNFAAFVITQNDHIPLIICNEQDEIIDYVNINEEKIEQKSDYLANQLQRFKASNPPLEISYEFGTNYVYYGNSMLLNKLEQYPILLIIVLTIFILIVFITFSLAQSSIQNQVWVGMSKETAHQMGTPLSSIMGWIVFLKEYPEVKEYVEEMEQDIDRLQLVADRFSKIGSDTPLSEELIYPRINNMVQYMEKRAPKNVHFELIAHVGTQESKVLMNGPLFDWVIENILRNALDALEGNGWIKLELFDDGIEVILDISNNGQPIPKKNFKSIFQPGQTTKKRGWGLGLSLAKRIIEKYHYGSILVKQSDEKETTFRITLRR